MNNEVRWLHLNTGAITNGVNPSMTSTATGGVGNGAGITNSIGSINFRNTIQTWKQVDMRAVVGEEWRNKYKTFGMRPVFINWGYHEQLYQNNPSRFLRVTLTGLPFVNAYNVGTKTVGNSQLVIGCTPWEMTNPTTRVYTCGYGNLVFPACEFQLLDFQQYHDLTITYANTDGSATTFPGGTTYSYALPPSAYAFIIWPIQSKKPFVEMHGFPLQKTKRLRIGNSEEENEEDEE